MRKIDKIIIHCSATNSSMDIGVREIRDWHKNRGYNDVGYHFVIRRDGVIEAGRAIEIVGAHCRGQNSNSVGVCWVGGIDDNGRVQDNRTEAQKRAMVSLLRKLKSDYPTIKEIKGHRDYSPDINKNGKIEPNEWLKGCPSFDVAKWLTEVYI